MEFALSEDQRLLQNSIVNTLETVSSLDEVRRFAAGEQAAVDAMTEALRALGSDQLLIPQAHDGLGLGALEAALVHEALGASVSPASCLGQALATEAIKLAGSEAQQANWFGALVGGHVRFAAALNEAISRREDAGLSHHEGRLSGKALFVFDMVGATHLLTTDKAGTLFIVDVAANGLSVQPLATIDKTRPSVELVFDAVEAEPLLGQASSPEAPLARLMAFARILLAADTLGAAQSMLDKSVVYAAERKQFGRLIGSFQAVKHMCADMAARLEPARALIWHAGYLYDHEPETGALMACLAKSHMSEIGTYIARTATEVHGGMGFTDLLGLHYWFKRIGANRQWFGGPEALRLEAARLQGWA